MIPRNLLLILFCFFFLSLHQPGPGSLEYPDHGPDYPQLPEFLSADHRWADSVLESLNLEDRIAQMMMVQAYSNLGEAHVKSVMQMVSRYHVGGLAFFQGDPLNQALLINQYQQASKIPLLVAIDGETGLGMRLKNTVKYPLHMTLGAISDPELVYLLGKDIAAQMRRLGVHLNFAPVADVSNNPNNPVITTRSFCANPRNVAEKVVAYSRGLQSGGVLVAAKHFPGHGDTDTDSHHGLPMVPYGRERLDSVELYPFREAINRGLSGIMVAHLEVPQLDPRPHRAASVSEPVVTGLLKEELGFGGLIITDALNMKGLSQYFEPGERELEAVKAGNDILLMPSDLGRAINEIKRAVKRGEIPEERINASCRKILLAKYWAGLAGRTMVDTTSLVADLNRPAYEVLRRELLDHSHVLVKNTNDLLPLDSLEKRRIATVSISRTGEVHHGHTADLYLGCDHFTLPGDAGESRRKELYRKLEPYNTILVSILNTSAYASRKYGITPETEAFVAGLDPSKDLVLNVAGFPYALKRFRETAHLDAIILSFDDDSLNQSYALQGIFGGRGFSGRLPVGAEPVAPEGSGEYTWARRLAYGDPLEAGLDPGSLSLTEDLIEDCIQRKVFPGCQLLVARHGKVVWNRSYGYHTYMKKQAVRNTDIYDLASITKIAAILPSLMRLREQGLFSETATLGHYDIIPDSSNKSDLSIADILSHQAGLVPWIPFYHITLEPLDSSRQLTYRNRTPVYALKIGPSEYANRNVKYRDGYYRHEYDPEHPVQVADHLYMRKDLQDSLFRMIHLSGILSREYRYSDLGYYLLKQIFEDLSDSLLYPYAWHNFYAPLGAESLGFLPLNRFSPERIVPTENDLFFRRQLLRGHVHDPGAAMLGGVAGHAGLFGTAGDLAKLMQMYLNGGTYGGRTYLQDSTLQLYTTRYKQDGENRRALGFDKPVTDEPGEGPACDDASASSFGHSGFTGCLAWADPEEDLLFIFLSNRIHPDQANTSLIDEDIRTRLQQMVYDAIGE